MTDLIFESPAEIAQELAQKCRDKRLSLNLSQKSLSERSLVSISVIKQFESTGKIALESLLKIALILGSLKDFKNLFKPDSPENALTLDQILNQSKTRKRGRQ